LVIQAQVVQAVVVVPAAVVIIIVPDQAQLVDLAL
jgi:hypothetical protein